MNGTDRGASSTSRGRRSWTLTGALAAVCVALMRQPATSAPAPPVAGYERDYPAIDYAGDATRNSIAELQRRLASGDVALTRTPGRGYLDSLLEALRISASSQVLVFSKTSLQAIHIDANKPRALYFNDSTYVGWVQESNHLEILTIDADRGPVFFTVENAPPEQPRFKRESTLCLACHDSAGMRAGGTPSVLVRSSQVVGEMNPAGRVLPATVTHATAIEDRWGGWYVTGRLGVQLHLGNMPLAGAPDSTVARISNRSNLPSLAGYVDTAPYMSDKSDIVALLVLEHQSYIHNLITRAKYTLSGSQALARGDIAWEELAGDERAALAAVLEPLADAMTFRDERRLLGRIRGNAGYEAAFAANGPADRCGRSLRDFELETRTFKYPLSYLVYSPEFRSLPSAARKYLYERFDAILRLPTGDDSLDRDRAASLEILAATLPEFASLRSQRPSVACP
jgi:hypothetical protein